jgi:hypothetical protein
LLAKRGDVLEITAAVAELVVLEAATENRLRVNALAFNWKPKNKRGTVHRKIGRVYKTEVNSIRS